MSGSRNGNTECSAKDKNGGEKNDSWKWFSDRGSESSLGSAASCKSRSACEDKEIQPNEPNANPLELQEPTEDLEPKATHTSSYLPAYFEPPGPSKRVLRLKKCRMRIRNVIDKSGIVDVAFRDPESKESFQYLRRQMSLFYGSPEGFGLMKPLDRLVTGEIVAAAVHTFIIGSHGDAPIVLPTTKYRRVQRTDEGYLDIDDLTPCQITSAFSLIDEFYRHPAQAYKLKISNFHDLCPKNIFEKFVDEDQESLENFKVDLSCSVLRSIIGKTVLFSNLLSEHEGGNHFLTGKLNLTAKSWYISCYLEAFCKQNIPNCLKRGEMAYGHGYVTDVKRNGEISICAASSLFQSIDQFINTPSFVENHIINDKEHAKELFQNVEDYTTFLTFDNNDKSRICRMKVLASDSKRDVVKILLLDKANISYIDFSQLVYVKKKNRNVPALLRLIPPQAVKYHLAGRELMTESECKNILGKKVRYKVVYRSRIKSKLPEVEIVIDVPSSNGSQQY